MQTWKLTLEYDGTRYHGWQRQPNVRSVQGEFAKAAEKLFTNRVEINGSGRTDAGVHALAQVAHLRVNLNGKPPAPQNLQFALNDLLPADINVLRVVEAPHNFHARHDAIARYYIYQIATRRTAFGKPYVWWIKDSLDTAKMAAAARILIGRHDFSSFSEKDKEHASTIVEVETAKFFIGGGLICFRIGASHFLWKMVRRIVGSLVEVGRGKLSISNFERMLEKYSNEPATWTAPPSGLFLEKVLYAGEAPPTALEPAFPVR
jgi:tRNA pseudouridine38-40 synthase